MQASPQVSGTGTSLTPTLGVASTAGNLLVAVLNAASAQPWSLPAGWVQDSDRSNNGVSHATIFYYIGNPGGITSVVCTLGGSGFARAALAEFSPGAGMTVTYDSHGTGIAGALAATCTVSSAGSVPAGDLAVVNFMEHLVTAAAVTWTDPAGFTLLVSDGAAGAANHQYSAYQLSVAAGTVTATATSSVATASGNGWAATIAVFRATAAGGSGASGLVGSSITPNIFTPPQATLAQAIDLWQSPAYTNRTLTVRRAYFWPPGTIPAAITADFKADADAGRKVCMDLKPAFNPPYSTDQDRLNTFLSSCKAYGLTADVSLWHEPAGDMTASQFIAMFQAYGPVVQQYYPVVYCVSEYSAQVFGTARSYYPGGAYVDKLAADIYCAEYFDQHAIRLDVMAAIADGEDPPKPFGIYEFNANLDKVGAAGPGAMTPARVRAFFGYIQGFFTARLAAGKDNADILLFNFNGPLSDPPVGPGDLRIPLYQSMFDNLNAVTGAGTPPVAMAAELDVTATASARMTAPVTAPGSNPGQPPIPGWPQLVVEAAFFPPQVIAPPGSFVLGDPVAGILGTGKLATGVTWVDITGYGRSVDTARPSARVAGPLVTYQPGTAVVVLDNSGGQFDPDNLGGPYVYGGQSLVVPMVAVRVSAVLGATVSRLFSAFADGWAETAVDYSAGYAETTLTATDGFKILAGRNLATLTATGVGGTPAVGGGETSGARIRRILDAAGWFTGHRHIDAGNSGMQATVFGSDALSLMQLAADSELGELYINGAGDIVFRRRHAIFEEARSNTVQAVFGDRPDSGANFLTGQNAGFEGGLGTWNATTNSPTLADTAAAAHSGANSMSLTSTAVSGNMSAASFAAASITTQGMPVVPGDKVTASAWFVTAASPRSVLVQIGWFDVNGVSLSNSAGATVTDGTAVWVQATVTAAAPASAAFCRVTATVQAVGGSGEIHYVDDVVLARVPELACTLPGRADDDTTLINDAQITIAGSQNMQEAASPASIAKYLFPRVYSRSDIILQSDAEALSYAQWVLYVSQDGEDRFDTVSIDPLADPANLFPQVLGRDIGDRIQVWRTPPGNPSRVTKDVFIRGIEHHIDCVNYTWQTTWTLQSAAKYSGFLILGSATLGLIGTGKLGP